MSAIENPSVPLNGAPMTVDGRAAVRMPWFVPSLAATSIPAVDWKPAGQAVVVENAGVSVEAPLDGLRMRLPGWEPSGGVRTFACAATGASTAVSVAAPA